MTETQCGGDKLDHQGHLCTFSLQLVLRRTKTRTARRYTLVNELIGRFVSERLVLY
jgi:hypothetical protein